MDDALKLILIDILSYTIITPLFCVMLICVWNSKQAIELCKNPDWLALKLSNKYVTFPSTFKQEMMNQVLVLYPPRAMTAHFLFMVSGVVHKLE